MRSRHGVVGGALALVPAVALAVSDGHFDVERQGCQPSDYSYDQKDVDHSGDGCETITIQAGPSESNDFVRIGVDHERESVGPHSGSVKIGPKGESPGDDSRRAAVVRLDSGYAIVGPQTLTNTEDDPSEPPRPERVSATSADATVSASEETLAAPERPLDWSHYFGMDDNWIFGEHHSTRQPGYEELDTGPVSGGGWTFATHPDTADPASNVDPTDRERPVRAGDGVMGFCNDGICMSITTEERTVYEGGDESAEPRPAYIPSGNPPNGGGAADDGSDGQCNFRDPDPDCQEYHDEQGDVYVPWGINFYQDPHPAGPDRFGPDVGLWDYPMPSTHVGSEGVRLFDMPVLDIRAHATVEPPRNLGHRGTGTNSETNPYPENTVASFLQALAEGADGIELDVELAMDDPEDGDPFNELVIMHDESLTRTTTCDGEPLDQGNCVGSRTTADIQLNCLPVNGLGQTFPGEVVPTLEQSLAAVFATKPEAIVNIEIKSQPPTDTDSAQELCSSADPEHRSTIRSVDLVNQKFADRKKQIVFSSFDPTAVRAAKDHDPEVNAAYLSIPANNVPGAPPLPLAVNGAIVATALALDGLHPNTKDTTAEVVDLANELGLEVRPWTVNQRCDMRRLIDLGVDAIITDEPDLLDAELASPSSCP